MLRRVSAALLLGASPACGAPPSQLRVHLAPSTDSLVAAWTTLGAAPSGVLEFGATPATSDGVVNATSTAFGNVACPDNSTRTSFFAAFPVAAGSSAYYRVSADGGASWSAPRAAANPARGFPSRVALWGDLGVECGGVLPPSPGFAGGQCSAAGALAADAAAGAHDWALHFGDTAYNMDDECGAKGDRFLDVVESYSAGAPRAAAAAPRRASFSSN
jgi:hypothetical protein